MSFRVERMGPGRREDFFRLHHERIGAGWCHCVAWWVETWDGWGERTAEENRALREALFDRGEHDGYLLYDEDEPVGWCQAGPRDRLEKLVAGLGLAPDPEVWSVTCFLVAPAARRKGAATSLLEGVLSDLATRGVRRVEAYPKRGEDLDEGDLWNGPEALFRAAGFEVVRDSEPRAVLARDL